MSHAAVFASAESRLHADILVVRLKNAGIATEAISLLYPGSSQPNSALCWLNGVAKFSLPSGEVIASSGRFGASGSDAGTLTLEDKLSDLGFAPDQTAALEEILCEGRIVVVVEAEDRDEAGEILETLCLVGVENIFLANCDLEPKLAAA